MNDLSDLIPEDEALRARAIQLGWRMLQEAEDILEYGSPRDKIRLLTANLPALTRAAHTDESAQMDKVRDVMTDLMTEVRGALLGPGDDAA